ncbi:unnamed protein product [Rhodiola kirilowii]
MAIPLLLILILSAIPISQSQLSETYYHKTCPKFEQIVADTVTNKQLSTPTAAAGTLRLIALHHFTCFATNFERRRKSFVA